MANCVIILGKSGTGKSTSIKNLDPKSTVVFNTLGKMLPFKGSRSIFNKENKNAFKPDELDFKNCSENYQKVKALLEMCNGAPKIKNIILDDIIYVMRSEYFKRAKESGYGKYTELAQHFQEIIKTCETLREDLNVFFMLHSEDVVSDNAVVEYKVSTIGKLLDSQLG